MIFTTLLQIFYYRLYLTKFLFKMSHRRKVETRVVFRKHNKQNHGIPKDALDVQCREIVRDITKQSLRTKIEVMRAEYERGNDKRNLKFSRLLEAVGEANVQGNRATEKFLDDIESIMTRFNDELGSLQKTYSNIMKKLAINESK